MHPVRGKAHSYRVQTTGTGRGLSESRDTRKGNSIGWDAGSRIARGRGKRGGMLRKTQAANRIGLVKGSGMLGKRQEAQQGRQGCTAVFQEQGQNRNDLAAYDTAHIRRVRRGCSPAVSWKTAMHPVRGKAHSYRLPSTNEPDARLVAISCLGLTGAGARKPSEQRRDRKGSAEIASEAHPRDPQR